MKSSSIAAAVLACCVFASFIAAQDEISKISGRVLSTQGVPVAGALVYATGVTTTTDGNGAFSISVKAESEDLELLVKASGFALFHTPLSLESLHTEIIARLEPPRVAIVRVVGEDGKPIRLATVHGRIPFAAAYSALERADFNATTDQDGIAVIRDIPADGALIAEVRPPGMVPGQSATLVPVPEPAPADLARAAETIVVSPGRGLRIAVENDAGRPVAGAAVSLLPLVEPRLDFGGNASRDTTRGSIRSATTDAAGVVTFEHLPANPVTCEVRAAGLLTQLLVVEGGKGGAKPIRVKLRPDSAPPATDVPWRASVAIATEESARTGLPIFLVMTMDGEKANEWMAGHHYHDPEIVRAARAVIPILSSAFGEGGVGESDHREKDGKCTRYGTISCRAHQEIERLAREALMQTRMVFEVPRHIASTATGERLFEKVFYLSERDLVRLILRALRITRLESAVALARERLSPVVEDLASSDGAVRQRGARALGLLANSGDEHAAALVQGLTSLGLPTAVRVQVVEQLHPAAITSPATTFADLVTDPDRDVRRALFSRLGEASGDEAVVDRLASEIRKNDGPAREALLRALLVDKKSDELTVREPARGNRWRIVEELIEVPEAGRVQGLDDALRDVERPARHRLLRALGRRASSDPAALDVLIRALKGPSPVAAARALGRGAATVTAPNSSAVRALLDAARSSDLLLREEALHALASIDAPADVQVLAGFLADASSAVRINAALALWRRGDRSGEKILMAALSDRELGAQVQAALRK